MKKSGGKTGRRSQRLASAVGLTVVSLAGPAWAQENATGAGDPALTLGPVSVAGDAQGDYKVDTAASPKMTAPLLDTPQTVTVVPQAIIREQGARTLTEVLKNTPGISFNAGENGFATSTNYFSLRGFDTSGSIFVDGARDNGSYARDVFNVEQVEVVKGPAADNGRGGPGGYINMVTKTPQLTDFINGDVSIGFDEYDSRTRKRVTADVNHAVGATTALRLNAVFEDSGIAGRELVEKDTWGIAPSLAVGLGTDLRGILSYEHTEHDDRPDWGVPGATIKGTRLYDPTTRGASRSNFYGLRSDFDDVESDAVMGRVEYDLTDRITASNQLRWARVDRQARYTVPTAFVPATGLVNSSTQFYDRMNTSLSNLTDLSARFATGAFRHQLSAGFEITREESEASRTGTNNPGATDLFNPDPDRAGPVTLAPTQFNDVRVTTYAFYLYDTVEIAPQWQVTGGIRAERYKVRIDSRDTTGAPIGTLGNYDDSEFSLGGKIGLVYKPAENGSVYASFGSSTLPPGSFLSNSDISRTGDNAFPGFVDGADPIRAYNYEIGTKWDLMGGRLSTTAALFRTEKTNVPITGIEGAETTATLKGYGEQIVQGLELSAAGQITPEWAVFAGFSLIDSERKHSARLDAARRAANPGDYGTVLRTSGDELAFTPDVSGNLWTTYRLPVGLTVGGGVQYVGSSWLGRPDDALRIIPNGAFGKLPDYWLVNLMASYELTPEVDLRLNIDNLFNDRHAVSTNWNGSRALLGPPRSFLISTSFSF